MNAKSGGKYIWKGRKEIRAAVILAAALMVLGTTPVTVLAAAQVDAVKNLVFIAGMNPDSTSTVYSTGILIDAGNHSAVITSETVDWSEYQCIGKYAASNFQDDMSLEFTGSGQGAAIFKADRDYGGFSENEILRSEALSEGDGILILSFVYTAEDNGIQIISKENHIEGFHDEEGAVFVETKNGFEVTDFGGMVLTETGQFAGVVVPVLLNESPCLFLSMDAFFKTKEPEESGNGNGTPNLLKDSYFMRIALVVLAAMAGSLYVYMNRKAKNGGKTVYLEDQASTGDGSAEIMLIGSGYFQGRGFDISKAPVIFGRNPALCTAVYPKDTKGISSLHCRIEVSVGKILLTDLGSSYGTFLEDGTKLPANVPCELQRGNRFYLADRVNMFQIQ